MQKVSEAWKSNQNGSLVSKGYVELSFEMTDPEAQADASAASDGAVSFASTENIVSEVSYFPDKYATLEDNLWVLDGSFRALESPLPKGNNGYIGEVICGEDGTFQIPPVVTIGFSKTYTTLLQGVTITWGEAYTGEYASDFVVTAYNGSIVVAQKSVSGNDALESFVAFDIQNFNKITVQILKWNKGFRRPRIAKFRTGVVYVFNGSDLKSLSHSMYSDLLSTTLPKVEVKFEIFNTDHLYNPENPEGIGKYLLERQRLKLKYGYRLGSGVEWIDGAVVYLNEWRTPASGISASFSARDVLEFMSEKYAGRSSGTLYEIATDALNQAELPVTDAGENAWYLDPSLSRITAPAGLNLSENTIAEILQMVANAGCCVMTQDRKGILRIEKWEPEAADYIISKDNSYSFPEITLDKPVKSIDINSGMYLLSVGKNGEVLEIQNELISDSQAAEVANWVKKTIEKRQCLSGSWRADPRLDCLDLVNVESQFGICTTAVNDISWSYSGAIRGDYSGRKTG